MIARRIEQKVFRDIAPQVIRHVKAVPQKKATGLVKVVYDQMALDFQIVPVAILETLPAKLGARLEQNSWNRDEKLDERFRLRM